MSDREKVIKGLECCILHDPDDHYRCAECPYNTHDISNAPCANGLKWNALELLKEQEGQIIELKEKLRLMEYGDQDAAQSLFMPAT